MQYLHLSNLNENLQVLGNLKFLDLIDDGILEEKTSINEKVKIFVVCTQFFFSLRLFILILTAIRTENTICKFKALKNISLKFIKIFSNVKYNRPSISKISYFKDKLLNTSIK